jgi:hypothetical protein
MASWDLDKLVDRAKQKGDDEFPKTNENHRQ